MQAADILFMRRGRSVSKWSLVGPITVTEITRVPAGWLLTVEGAPEKLELYSKDGSVPQWEAPLDA